VTFLPERIKLLYVIPSFGTGGTERLVADLVTSLDPNRFDASVCIQQEGLIGHELTARGYRVHTLNGSLKGGAQGPVRKLRSLGGRVAALRALIRRERINIVHTHHIGPLMHAFLAGLGARRWRWIHTEHIRPDIDTGYSPWLTRVGAWMFSSADMVTGVSDAVGAYFHERRRVPHDRVKVICNAVNVDRFAERNDSAAKRRDLGIPLEAWVIGLVANLRPQKNHELLLHAFARLLSKEPVARLVLAGDGNLRGALEALAHQLGVQEQVHFLGARSDVPELFATFDVYCLPSHYEGMPLTVLEAMAAGKPVVATNVVGIGEVVTHDKTGLLVPPDDPDALAQALMRVRQDRNLCRDLAEAGRAYAFKHARLKTMVDQYAALYEQVLAV
jgi:glycosyltransferase involved in cell wall biosynthesis